MKTIITLSILSFILFACDGNPKDPMAKEAVYIASEEFAALGMPFSQAVRYGDIIYVSGHEGELGMTKEGVLIEGGIGPETRQTMLNIKKVLEENGSSMDNIIKCTCMLADINDWPAMNVEYVKFFPNHMPARSAFATNGLSLNARVEIECMAYVNQD
jgi:2-iminobutanoate/2-iminopropanoate deaminase